MNELVIDQAIDFLTTATLAPSAPDVRAWLLRVLAARSRSDTPVAALYVWTDDSGLRASARAPWQTSLRL